MKKRVFALFTAMFLLCGMLAGCGPTGSSSTTTDGSDDGAKDTLIVAIPESPTYMDPMVQASIGTYRVTTQMFDRLVMMDNDMNLVPGLAESWEVIDDTTTVFHLRQGGHSGSCPLDLSRPSHRQLLHSRFQPVR